MKTCLIYGHGGLDLDVTFNLLYFYKRLGFKTYFSEKLYDADLLVVVRAINKVLDLTSFNYSNIHIFDYGGWDYDEVIKSINNKITYIFCTSEVKKKKAVEELNFPEQNIFIALPPVELDLWILPEKKIKYEFVHIGNYKPISNDDPIKEKFLYAIEKLKVNVWGLNWNNKLAKGLYKGKAGLFEVSSIYAQSKFALGLMYPFQRNYTFSGRFWHAPLNGCFLFSEPGVYTNLIPGVIETDYSINDIENHLNKSENRIKLMISAKQFWTNQNNIIRSIILPTLNLNNNNNVYLQYKRYFIFLRLLFSNIFRYVYQKYKIFKIIK